MSGFDDEESSGVFDTPYEVAAVPAEQRARVVAGRYEIVEQLGAGGMGQVFRVRHIRLGKAFALKLMHAELSLDPEAERLFHREAKLASQLSHPNIVETIDFGNDPDWGWFLVMEYLEGESLAKRLARVGMLPIAVACEVAVQLADALQHSHERGVVHGDLKSENVLCVGGEHKWQVKLLDFGTAHVVSATGSTDHIAGTPEYLAPERITGAPPQPSSDVYALGIILYEMLCATTPFAGGDTSLTLHRHLAETAEPVATRRREPVDIALEVIVMKALAKAPTERYASAQAIGDSLRIFLDAMGVTRRLRTETPVPPTDHRLDAAAAAFDALRVPAAGLQRDGTIEIANAAFAHLLGFPDAAAVEGKNARQTLLAKLNDELVDDLRVVALEGRVVRRHFLLPRGDKKVRVRYIMAPATGAAGHCLVVVHSA